MYCLQATIESLKKENQLLLSKPNINENDTANNEKVSEITHENDSQVPTESNDFSGEMKPHCSITSELQETPPAIFENNSKIDLVVPFKKLEKRFKETMERLADLMDEKQRLEHLVTQLQGETETIGKKNHLYSFFIDNLYLI